MWLRLLAGMLGCYLALIVAIGAGTSTIREGPTARTTSGVTGGGKRSYFTLANMALLRQVGEAPREIIGFCGHARRDLGNIQFRPVALGGKPWSNSAIVRLSAIVSLGASTRFGGTCCRSCASLESKNEVCLLCEVSPKANPSLQIHLCFFGEQSQPLKILGKGEKVWEDIQVVPGFVGRERRLFGEVAVLSPQVV
ncbi:hypothetical protein Tco_0938374 [Tanacetum coccineum]|uniref:Uncharacterized protein n=1 Tax=Tanacetum coccineum TaxID=301880 RepID=A0ABQ5DHN3_9ASTR